MSGIIDEFMYEWMDEWMYLLEVEIFSVTLRDADAEIGD